MNTERPGQDHEFDAAVDRAWREASNEAPPPDVDAAILAAARSPRRSIRTWQPLAAVATVAGLAFLLVQLMPRDRDVAPPVRMESATPAESKAAPVQKELAPQEPTARQEPARAREVESPAVGITGPAAPPVAADPVEAKAASNVLTPEAPTRSGSASNEIAADAAAVPAAASAPAALAAPTGQFRRFERADVDSQLSPQSWAARVESLYESGDLETAATELRNFRAAIADADRYLSDALRDWAAGID